MTIMVEGELPSSRASTALALADSVRSDEKPPTWSAEASWGMTGMAPRNPRHQMAMTRNRQRYIDLPMKRNTVFLQPFRARHEREA
jgi:hypothetical protein